MAQRTTAARGQDILDRWCALAEQRLEHLTDLFETGRWRRFHSEVSFLENIQEAKAAVETWRKLATREASLDNSVIDRSWLDRPKAVPPRRESFLHFPIQPSACSVKRLTDRIEKNDQAIRGKIADQPLVVLAPPIAAQSEPITAQPASNHVETPARDTAPELTLDLAVMQARYPLLRNAL